MPDVNYYQLLCLKISSISFESESVKNLYGQYERDFVPILIVLRFGSFASIKISMYFENIFAFMIIGSPPVNNTSVISGCSLKILN